MTKTETGFTLIEVLVALIIAGLALGVLYQGSITGIKSVRTASDYEEALSRARSHLDALLVPGAMTGGIQSGDDGGGYRWETEEEPLGIDPEPTAPGGTLPVLVALSVTVSWQMDGDVRSVNLRSERLGIVAQNAH